MPKLWSARFQSDMTENVLAFSESTAADGRMVAEDIWGSEAHALMLARQGIISEDDLRVILLYLEKARGDFELGEFTLRPELEDVHMNVETYLISGAGREFGGKLHTARSRNDQVVTDARMHTRQRLLDTSRHVIELQRVLLDLADEHAETVMPGYTHVQHAQPITLGFWASGYASMLSRDLRRLSNAFATTNLCPLGAAALAGTSFPTDRDLTAKLLGFDAVLEHSLDAVASRDFVVESLAALAIVMSNLSRLAEELVFWSSFEFRLIELDDAYCTGSSIMPQKKNPCIAELTRGKTGVVYGRLMQVLTMLKGIPTAYNRDLQEDKPPLWEAFDCAQHCLRVMAGGVGTMRVNTERMAELAGANFATATELANYLVRERGLPFRECHEIVGGTVGALVAEAKTFGDLTRTREVLAERGIEIAEDTLREILDPEVAVGQNKSLGGTSPAEVRRMIEALGGESLGLESEVEVRQARIDEARAKTAELVEGVLSGKALANLPLPM